MVDYPIPNYKFLENKTKYLLPANRDIIFDMYSLVVHIIYIYSPFSIQTFF